MILHLSFFRALLFLLLASAFQVTAATSKSTFFLPRFQARRHPSPLDKTALGLLRGGGSGVFATPVQPNYLVGLYVGANALQGAVAYPAPEKAYIGLEICEGTLSHLLMEAMGATMLSTALMAYLSIFSSVDGSKRIAYAGIIFAYALYQNHLKGNFKKLGIQRRFCLVQDAILVTCIYLILSESKGPKLAAKIFAGPPAIAAIVGVLAPEVCAKHVYGLDSLTGSTSTIFAWFHNTLLGWSVLAWLILLGDVEPRRAIGFAALAEAIAMLDCVWGRKWNSKLDLPEANDYLLLLIRSVTAIGLLLG